MRGESKHFLADAGLAVGEVVLERPGLCLVAQHVAAIPVAIAPREVEFERDHRLAVTEVPRELPRLHAGGDVGPAHRTRGAGHRLGRENVIADDLETRLLPAREVGERGAIRHRVGERGKHEPRPRRGDIAAERAVHGREFGGEFVGFGVEFVDAARALVLEQHDVGVRAHAGAEALFGERNERVEPREVLRDNLGGAIGECGAEQRLGKVAAEILKRSVHLAVARLRVGNGGGARELRLVPERELLLDAVNEIAVLLHGHRAPGSGDDVAEQDHRVVPLADAVGVEDGGVRARLRGAERGVICAHLGGKGFEQRGRERERLGCGRGRERRDTRKCGGDQCVISNA